MNQQRRKHLRKLASRARKRETRHISEVYTLSYKSIFVRYLPKVDDFIMFIEMMVNGTELRVMGVITPESLVEDGIQIITPENAIDKSMTCRELYLTRADIPNLFSVVKAFYNTIGDLWDAGEEITSLREFFISGVGQKVAGAETGNNLPDQAREEEWKKYGLP